MTTNWYDFPQYFDMAFADETQAEANFLEAAAQRYALRKVKRLLEPGCGGGRLVVEMARRGYRVTGFDNNTAAVRLAQGRLRKGNWDAEVELGELAQFRLNARYDMAFCTFNTFRHLVTEEEADSHLKSAAESLAPGGIYVLGFHLLPPDAAEDCTERWQAAKGKTRVHFTLRVMSCSRRRRLEHMRMNMLVRSGATIRRMASEFDLRIYTAAQVKSLLARTPEFKLVAVHNFDYEIEQTLRLDNELGDAVFVLRKE